MPDANPPVSKLRAAGAPTSPDILAEDLEIPDVAAGLVHRWSDEVTAGATTDYDRAIAIQRHLRDTTRYTYSLDLGEPPTNDNGQELDPITAFYETRRGYCTQFATAMIMLARAQGIPARMAIGFIPGTREGSSNIVKASDAHAWPELYFEGSGWLRFEPTTSRSGPPANSVPGQVTPGDGATAPSTATGTATQTRSERQFQEGEDAGSMGDDVLGRPVADRHQPRHPHHRSRRAGTFLMPLTAWVARSLRRRRAVTRQDLVEIEWDALMSHFDDLGLPATPGSDATVCPRALHHRGAPRRRARIGDASGHGNPRTGSLRPAGAHHSGADGGAPPGHSLNPTTGVGTRLLLDDPGQVLPVAHRGRLRVASADRSPGTGSCADADRAQGAQGGGRVPGGRFWPTSGTFASTAGPGGRPRW